MAPLPRRRAWNARMRSCLALAPSAPEIARRCLNSACRRCQSVSSSASSTCTCKAQRVLSAAPLVSLKDLGRAYWLRLPLLPVRQQLDILYMHLQGQFPDSRAVFEMHSDDGPERNECRSDGVVQGLWDKLLNVHAERKQHIGSPLPFWQPFCT